MVKGHAHNSIDRFSATLLALLALVWLLVLGDSPVIAIAGVESSAVDCSLSAHPSDPPSSAWPVKSLRRAGRRFGYESDADEAWTWPTANSFGLYLRQAGHGVPRLSTPPNLSQTWRFHSRAAAEPRAPSIA